MTRFFKFLPEEQRQAFFGKPKREGVVSSTGTKLPRLRLDSTAYELLWRQVLIRDGWRCQSCGSMSNLEVHHKQFRSHSGPDSEQNLITLCAPCHIEKHNLRQNNR